MFRFGASVNIRGCDPDHVRAAAVLIIFYSVALNSDLTANYAYAVKENENDLAPEFSYMPSICAVLPFALSFLTTICLGISRLIVST